MRTLLSVVCALVVGFSLVGCNSTPAPQQKAAPAKCCPCKDKCKCGDNCNCCDGCPGKK